MKKSKTGGAAKGLESLRFIGWDVGQCEGWERYVAGIPLRYDLDRM